LSTEQATPQTHQITDLADHDAEATRRLSALLSTDPRLSAIVTAWHDLPEPIRAGIAAMVKAAGAS
jgi:hypothetical protein